MPYTVLYRKKRPRTFTEIVGQPHVVEALRNQLRGGAASHAYLFCGTRGTGKTTAARIMARAVNCTSLQDGNPCNTCPPCESILADRSLDVTEIDAASNNSVDDIRNLREEVKYPPTECTHKVYIIDEVHMLSASAFNALLKTLEEPPPHVVFILATTDPQKVPVTVLSRCQRYDFRRIKTPDIVATLDKYLREENAPYEPEALALIAYHCDGAMRDALSLLDQALSLRHAPKQPLTLTCVRDLLGAVDRAVLFAFADALAADDGAAVLSLIDAAAKDGRDMGQFAVDLIRHFRDTLVASLINTPDALDVSADAAAQLKVQGAAIGTTRLMAYIRAFSEMQRELRFATHKRTALEVCALELCAPASSTPAIKVAAPRIADTPTPTPTPTPTTNNDDDIPAYVINDWQSICNALAQPLRSLLARCHALPRGTQLLIQCDSEAGRALIESHKPAIRQALAERYNISTPPELLFEVKPITGKKRDAPPSPAAHEPVPAKQATAPKAPMTEEDNRATFGQQEEDDWTSFGQPEEDDWSAFGQPETAGKAPW